MAGARWTMIVAGGLAILEQNREGLVAAVGLGLSALMDRARMAAMSWYGGSVQAVTAGSVEEDELRVVTVGISATGLNTGCAYWASSCPLNWVLDNAP